METITGLIEKFGTNLKENKKKHGMQLGDFVSLPMNTVKALPEDIEQTEAKLSIRIPDELRNYYLNEANGNKVNVTDHQLIDGGLDIFSHQKIFGVYDYFDFYWSVLYEGYGIELMDEQLSDSEMEFVLEKNKEFFVCAADWSDNFIETFVFDKEGNFYRFYFDQDLHIFEYIQDMLSNHHSINKSHSFSKLLSEYLDKIKGDS